MNLGKPARPEEIAHYTAHKVSQPLIIDGKLSEAAWQAAKKSPRFVDVIGGNPGLYDTRSAVLWDDDYLYVAFWCEEPYVDARITQRDELIFAENDVEVFIDGGDCYYEFEMNARNTLYEVFFIWRDAYQPGGRFDVPEFDIHQQDALTFGGNHDRTNEYFWRGTHPRGVRWAFRNWDMPGLKTAVNVDGKLNDATTPDQGWQAELAFPWKSMHWLANGRSIPPKEGDEWKIFFGRYEKLFLNGEETHVGWAWNRVGTADNHLPECFTSIHFSEKTVE
jgi:hypothetical protein